MAKPDITGTLIMEDRRKELPDGRTAVMVFGILAMPKETADEFCGDRPHQLVVQGQGNCGLLTLSHAAGMTLEAGGGDPDDDPDRHASMIQYYKCCTVDQLITSPIWRI